MRYALLTLTVAVSWVMGLSTGVLADEALPGADVQSLLVLAKANNPELAAMRFESQASAERVLPANALPDPKLRTEWMDVTKTGSQGTTLWPNDVGSTRYTLMQDLPWFGKRGLKKGIAEQEAQASLGKVQTAWVELAAKVTTLYAQRYFLYQSQKISHEFIEPDREQLARYGLAVGDLLDVVGTALGGEMVTTTVEGRERYGVTVRYPRGLRSDPQQMAHEVLVPTGAMVPLGQLAKVVVAKGAPVSAPKTPCCRPISMSISATVTSVATLLMPPWQPRSSSPAVITSPGAASLSIWSAPSKR